MVNGVCRCTLVSGVYVFVQPAGCLHHTVLWCRARSEAGQQTRNPERAGDVLMVFSFSDYYPFELQGTVVMLLNILVVALMPLMLLMRTPALVRALTRAGREGQQVSEKNLQGCAWCWQLSGMRKCL